MYFHLLKLIAVSWTGFEYWAMIVEERNSIILELTLTWNTQRNENMTFSHNNERGSTVQMTYQEWNKMYHYLRKGTLGCQKKHSAMLTVPTIKIHNYPLTVFGSNFYIVKHLFFRRDIFFAVGCLKRFCGVQYSGLVRFSTIIILFDTFSRVWSSRIKKTPQNPWK